MASVLLQHQNRVASKNIFVTFLTDMLETWKIISKTAGMVFPSYAISIEILKSTPFSFSTKIAKEIVLQLKENNTLKTPLLPIAFVFPLHL